MYVYMQSTYVLIQADVLYCIAGKFGELTLFEHLAKESLAN